MLAQYSNFILKFWMVGRLVFNMWNWRVYWASPCTAAWKSGCTLTMKSLICLTSLVSSFLPKSLEVFKKKALSAGLSMCGATAWNESSAWWSIAKAHVISLAGMHSLNLVEAAFHCFSKIALPSSSANCFAQFDTSCQTKTESGKNVGKYEWESVFRAQALISPKENANSLFAWIFIMKI